jgi:hypothetical protein
MVGNLWGLKKGLHTPVRPERDAVSMGPLISGQEGQNPGGGKALFACPGADDRAIKVSNGLTHSLNPSRPPRGKQIMHPCSGFCPHYMPTRERRRRYDLGCYSM